MSAATAEKRKADEPATDESNKRARTEPPANGAAAVAAPATGAAAPAASAAAPQPQAAPAPQQPQAQPQPQQYAPQPPPHNVAETLSRMTEDEKSKTTIQSLCVACTCLLSYPGSAVLIRCPNCDTITPRPDEAWFAPPPAPVSDLKRQASQWNINQVLVFIQNMGLQHLAPVFQAHNVHGGRLIELTRSAIVDELQITNEADVAGLLAVVDVLRTVPPAGPQQTPAAAAPQQTAPAPAGAAAPAAAPVAGAAK